MPDGDRETVKRFMDEGLLASHAPSVDDLLQDVMARAKKEVVAARDFDITAEAVRTSASARTGHAGGFDV